MMRDAPQERAKLEFSAEEFNQNGRDVVKVTCVCSWYLPRYKHNTSRSIIDEGEFQRYQKKVIHSRSTLDNLQMLSSYN